MHLYIIILLLLLSAYQPATSVLSGKVICLDAGHGGTAATDTYRVGPTGEREEWINLRVAKHLKELLKAEHALVMMTRTTDTAVSLSARAELAKAQGADVFLSIHHNATADSSVNFPIVYYHGNASENQASVRLGELVIRQLRAALFNDSVAMSLVSDHTIFPKSGTAVLRGTYGIPAIIGEATFFTNPTEEQKLKSEAYNRREAEAYRDALREFFAEPIPLVQEKKVEIPPFNVLQEAERMRPEALAWRENFERGEKQFEKQDWSTAYDYFTQSARSFPDSYLAREAHHYQAMILEKMDSLEAAGIAQQRVNEYYVPVK
ncbi:MAG: N-acetylmuramoyl-L-alanine amidase [Bacteroidota bacterium]